MQKIGDQPSAPAPCTARGGPTRKPTYVQLRDALGSLLDANAEIDELLDLFMPDAEPDTVEKRDQRRSNRERDQVAKLWSRAS